MKAEPVAIINAIVRFLETVVIMLVVLKVWDISTEGQAAIIASVVALGTVAQTLFARQKVSPVK